MVVVIECWSAFGVSHSLKEIFEINNFDVIFKLKKANLGKHRCKNGTHELKWAKLKDAKRYKTMMLVYNENKKEI
jgi:hypothetical protein